MFELLSLLSIACSVIAFVLLACSFQVKNLLIRTISLMCFLFLMPAIFGSFVLFTGEARHVEYDVFWDTPVKLEIKSYTVADELIYLWLLRPNDSPIYYVVPDPGNEKKKQLEQARKKAEQTEGKLFYQFKEGQAETEEAPEEEGDNPDGGIEKAQFGDFTIEFISVPVIKSTEEQENAPFIFPEERDYYPTLDYDGF